jgi:superfamily I DNA/RNA helicase
MSLPAKVEERLSQLAPDQRAAATMPRGPVLCIAPAGSGKTTTLVARVAWLVATGADPAGIMAIAFNRRAAEELSERIDAALEPLDVASGTLRVRTFHALGREILRAAGHAVEPLVDRDAILRRVAPSASPVERRRLDGAFSRLKLDLRVRTADVAADHQAGPIARAWVAYEAALAETGGLDFDDLVARPLALLEEDPNVLEAWRASAADLLVDEAQDLDRSQLQLALLLAAPANRIFLVGDDDQSIYGWRLADVRRVLALAEALPGLRRVDLEVNYRCPAPVVERAVRLVEMNRERFEKRVRPGPRAGGRLVLAPDASDESVRVAHALASWPADDGTRAFLARTNRELLPAAAAALERGLPFRAPPIPWPLESPFVDELLERAGRTDDRLPLAVRLTAVRDVAPLPADPAVSAPWPAAGESPQNDESQLPAFSRREVANALIGWAIPYPDLASLTVAVTERRERLTALRRDGAPLTLATAHATKGLEFDHVAVLCDGFPARRALTESAEPDRALEEERRLAYVAWTRARRSLTLVYDPFAPSPFLTEAFTAAELGLEATVDS